MFEGMNSDEFTPKQQKKKSSIENKRGDSRNENRTIIFRILLSTFLLKFALA